MPQIQNSTTIDENDPKVKAKKVTVWLYDSATDTSSRVSSSNPIPTGSSTYAIRIDDFTTTNVTYIGKAPIGSAVGSSVWQIQKIDETTGTVITWADGDANFDNVWGASGAVAGLSYS